MHAVHATGALQSAHIAPGMQHSCPPPCPSFTVASAVSLPQYCNFPRVTGSPEWDSREHAVHMSCKHSVDRTHMPCVHMHCLSAPNRAAASLAATYSAAECHVHACEASNAQLQLLPRLAAADLLMCT